MVGLYWIHDFTFRADEGFSEDGLVEEFLSQEDQEMEAIASMIEEQDDGGGRDGEGTQEKEMTEYGSDDDEYESLLMESVLAAERQRQCGEIRPQVDMDMEMLLD